MILAVLVFISLILAFATVAWFIVDTWFEPEQFEEALHSFYEERDR